MSKKSFIWSLVLSVIVTLSLGIYTLVSLFYVPTPKTPNKPYEPVNTVIEYAFRNGDEIAILDGYSEEDGTLTFVSVEGNTSNPISRDDQTGKYIAGNAKGSIKAVVTLNEKGDTNTYVITVYPHSDAGLTEDAPFIIASKANLYEFAAILNETGAARRTIAGGNAIRFAELVSDIDLGGENWIPMGNYSYMVEGLTFKGNGHTIKNMTINVNDENYVDYLAVETAAVNRGSIHLGFFGCIYNETKICDLNFDNAVINVAANVYENVINTIPAGATYGVFDMLNIGVVAGRMTGDCSIEAQENATVKASINGFSYVQESGTRSIDVAVNSGLGGVVGFVKNSAVKNYNVDLSVVNNVNVPNSNIGGIAGSVNHFNGRSKNVIEGCNVKIYVKAIYSNMSRIAGLAAWAYDADIKDCVVESIRVFDETYDNDVNRTLGSKFVTSVAGAVFGTGALHTETNIQNVTVKNINVRVIGGVASGFSEYLGFADSDNEVNVENCSVEGAITSREAYGFAKIIEKSCDVSYDENFEGKAVNVSLNGEVASGFVGVLNGTVAGYKDAQDNKTEMNVSIKGAGLLTPEQIADSNKLKAVYNNTYSSGFASKIYDGKVSNFKLNVKINDGINMAGVVYENDGEVDGLDVDATITSSSFGEGQNVYSTTYMVAGVACISDEGSVIKNVNVNLNVNQDVDKDRKYGTTFFGGLVARVQEDGVTLTNNTVNGNVYFNDTYYTANFGENAVYKVFVGGGLVGSFTKYGDRADGLDAFNKVVASNTVISQNTVENLVVVADYDFDKMETRDGFRVRALGVLVGNYYSDEALDLSSNAIQNASLSADIDTFTYGYNTTSGWTMVRTTLGYSTENKVVEYSYGISSALNSTGGAITDVAADQLANVSFTALNEEE